MTALEPTITSPKRWRAAETSRKLQVLAQEIETHILRDYNRASRDLVGGPITGAWIGRPEAKFRFVVGRASEALAQHGGPLWSCELVETEDGHHIAVRSGLHTHSTVPLTLSRRNIYVGGLKHEYCSRRHGARLITTISLELAYSAYKSRMAR